MSFITQTKNFFKSQSLHNDKRFSSHFSKTAQSTPKSTSMSQTMRKPYRQYSYNKSRHINDHLMEYPVKKLMKFTGLIDQNQNKRKGMTDEKWQRVMNLYEMYDTQEESNKYKIKPGANFYKMFLKIDLTQHKLKINFPLSISLDEDGLMQQLYTNSEGFIDKKLLKNADYYSVLMNSYKELIKNLKQKSRYNIYKNLIDIQQNINAPFIITKRSGTGSINQFSTEVQSYKCFEENRSKPTRQNFLQTYIYSRNMKAMVIRVCIKITKNNQQITVYRFQNKIPIFRQQLDIRQHTVKILLNKNRPDSMEYSILTNSKTISKYVQPTKQIKSFIEKVNKVKIKTLYLDFIDDLFDKPWLMNLKFIQLENQIMTISSEKTINQVGNVGYCKLCSNLFNKKQLHNSISVRMLIQFVQHLKKRTKIEDMQKIQFLYQLALNRRQNAMISVCYICYILIRKELQLKKYELQLARICNIRPSDELITIKINKEKIPSEMRQWRLMVYLEDIKNAGKGINSNMNVSIRYALSRNLEEKWKTKVIDKNNIRINNLKVQYFYSEENNIEEFLVNTEIILSILNNETEEILAQGSTGILSTFKNKVDNLSGQRQTSTVLLFFENGKYCELTLKVGLICDGVYATPNQNFKKLHSVYFPMKDCINSNPLPKEWMEAFGFDHENHAKQVTYEEILKDLEYQKNKLCQGNRLVKKKYNR